jgi:hypothetical protein
MVNTGINLRGINSINYFKLAFLVLFLKIKKEPNLPAGKVGKSFPVQGICCVPATNSKIN